MNIVNFEEHLIETAYQVKSDRNNRYASIKDMMRQTYEIGIYTLSVEFGSKEEELCGKIFDSIEEKISEILTS